MKRAPLHFDKPHKPANLRSFFQLNPEAFVLRFSSVFPARNTASQWKHFDSFLHR